MIHGEPISSKGDSERQKEDTKDVLGYNKIKKGAKRTVLILEMLKHGRITGKDVLALYGQKCTSGAFLTNALNSIPDEIAPYDYKEGKTIYIDCLRRERIQELLDDWYEEEMKAETTKEELKDGK